SRAVLHDGYRQLAERCELDVDLAVNEAVGFTLGALDPNGSWRPQDVSDRWPDGRLGVGLDLRLDDTTGQPCVVTPIKNGPAYRAGLGAGDVITHVLRMPNGAAANNHDVPEREPTAAAGLTRVEQMLSGPPDHNVVLTVLREGVPN